MKRPRIIILLLLAAALVVAASALNRTVAGIVRPKLPAPGRIVSVHGRAMHLFCEGGGSGTIVLEPGMGESWATFSRVMPALATVTRVCAYDRAGYGWSDPSTEPRTATRIADELHELLANAGITGRITLCAHSWGAYAARMFAAKYPASVAGLVLLDPASEDEPPNRTWPMRIHNMIPPSVAPELLAAWKGQNALPAVLREAPEPFQLRFFAGHSWDEQAAERAENGALDESRAEAAAAHFPRNLPVTVLTAAYIVTTEKPGSPQLPVAPLHFRAQQRLARLSSAGRQITAAHSGHLVQIDEPELVLKAIQEQTGGARCHYKQQPD